MSILRIRQPILILVLAAAFLLTGCPGPRVTPTAVPPTPPPVPVTPTPSGWVEHKSGDVTISLPIDWEVLKFSQGDLQSVFAQFQKTNPEMAKIIGSAEALQGVALWAFKTGGSSDDAWADNLNIRRTPLGSQKIEKMTDVLGPVTDQYKQLGFEVTATKSDLQIGGHPAAYVAYDFPVTGSDGKQSKVSGHQYLVATPTDLWILSYSAAPGNGITLAPVFEQSAQSFRVK